MIKFRLVCYTIISAICVEWLILKYDPAVSIFPIVTLILTIIMYLLEITQLKK